jgi:hypothetical protein
MEEQDLKKIGQIIFDLFSYVLLIMVIIAGFYFVISNSFEIFRYWLGVLAPGALFLLPAAYSIRRWLHLDDTKKSYDFTLYMTQGDIIILDILMYSAPALILFISAFNDLSGVNIIQALVAFGVILGWRTFLLKRSKR